MGPYFNPDRLDKYGYGVLRLAAVVLIAFLSAPSGHGTAADALAYWHSWRWIGHAYIGIIGAAVNVSVVSLRTNLAMLAVAGAWCAWDVRAHDLSAVIYLMKTFGGDFFAGKLDTTEWKLVLLFVFGLFGPSVLYLQDSLHSFSASYLRILIVLFCLQLFCEYGDNHMEHYKFFRHRYSYEVTGLALVLLIPLESHELAVVQYDMVICLFYRISNLIIIVLVNAYMSKLFVAIALKLHSFVIGVPVVMVTDPELVSLVLRECNKKGEALEKHLSVPAWKPILSLESEDGPLWKSMSKDFHKLLKCLPPVSKLIEIAQRNVAELKESHKDSVIDADILAKLTIETYLEYVLRCRWRSEFQIFIEASWQWRKEIAIKGKGDMAVKQRAVELFVQVLRETDSLHSLWDIFGEKWCEPEYYSLILQPFVISPCINVGEKETHIVTLFLCDAFFSVFVIRRYNGGFASIASRNTTGNCHAAIPPLPAIRTLC